jgi:hypothetical protein
VACYLSVYTTSCRHVYVLFVYLNPNIILQCDFHGQLCSSSGNENALLQIIFRITWFYDDTYFVWHIYIIYKQLQKHNARRSLAENALTARNSTAENALTARNSTAENALTARNSTAENALTARNSTLSLNSQCSQP